MRRKKPEQVKQFEENYKHMPDMLYRIVSNNSELRQKLLAFRMCRDDRIIELWKYYLFLNAQDQRLCNEKQSWNTVYIVDPVTWEETLLLKVDGEFLLDLCITDNRVSQMTKLFEEHANDADKNRYIYDSVWAEQFGSDLRKSDSENLFSKSSYDDFDIGWDLFDYDYGDEDYDEQPSNDEYEDIIDVSNISDPFTSNTQGYSCKPRSLWQM